METSWSSTPRARCALASLPCPPCPGHAAPQPLGWGTAHSRIRTLPAPSHPTDLPELNFPALDFCARKWNWLRRAWTPTRLSCSAGRGRAGLRAALQGAALLRTGLELPREAGAGGFALIQSTLFINISHMQVYRSSFSCKSPCSQAGAFPDLCSSRGNPITWLVCLQLVRG